MLQGLTGWSLRHFSVGTKLKSKNKRIGSKSYGTADTMLWEKVVDNPTTNRRRRRAKVTFRLHKADFLWVSACITEDTQISRSRGTEITISIARKAKGQLLDIREMVAIESEEATSSHDGHPSTSDDNNDLSELVLTFEKEHCKCVGVPLARCCSTCQSWASLSRNRADSLQIVTNSSI
jgi:hypothetical protein